MVVTDPLLGYEARVALQLAVNSPIATLQTVEAVEVAGTVLQNPVRLKSLVADVLLAQLIHIRSAVLDIDDELVVAVVEESEVPLYLRTGRVPPFVVYNEVGCSPDIEVFAVLGVGLVITYRAVPYVELCHLVLRVKTQLQLEVV